MARNNIIDRAKAPTGRNLSQEEYWKSLERSFDEDFIEAVWEEHDRRKRLPVD